MLCLGGNMKQSYYLYKSGRLQRKDNTLEIIYKDNSKKVIPIERVEDIYIMTEFDFNTALLNFLAQYGVKIHFFNYYGFYTGTYYPKESLVSGKLLIKQVENYTDINKRIKIAKAFIESASYNIHRNLIYYKNRGKNLEKYIKEIEFFRKQINKCKDVQELMGIEGNIRKVYYSSWNDIINQDIKFERRVKNPPDNAINSLISYVNTFIYTRVLSEIYKTQLNPTISYLHEPSERRFSLCLDIAEIFKPIIGDRLIFSMLNKNQITEKDFEKDLNFLYIKDRARKEIAKEIDKRLQKTIKHKNLERDVSYEYLIRLEIYKLIKYLLGNEEKYEGFKMWW
jgi:CRISPR-associated protein Cas1